MLLLLVLGAALGGRVWQGHTLVVPRSAATDIHRGTDYTPVSAPPPLAQDQARPEQSDRPAGAAPLERDPLTTEYLSQPALPITIVPQRVPVYIVQPGDSLVAIAEQFGIDVQSIQWANGLTDTAVLTPGQQLRIPPVKGMLHVVRPGDTLESIAATYKVSPAAITDYRPNQVRDAADLVAGRTIVVPGGTMPQRTTVIMHTVTEGETVFSIADRYNVTPETIVATNSLNDPDFLHVGQKLAILPVSGVGVIVQEGDTIAALAERYKVDENAIRSYGPNGLGAGGQLVVGQALVIPGGQAPPPPPRPTPEPEPEPEPQIVQASRPSAPAPRPAEQASTQRPPAPQPVPKVEPPTPARATGSMVWPATGSITTYFTYSSGGGHNGLDIANGFGTPIVAADGGVVTWAGWRNDGLGIAVFIDHGGGLQTWYGHLSRVVVSPGERVAKGQYLGPMGSTGKSTGPHLHFMVLQNSSYRNPLNYLP